MRANIDAVLPSRAARWVLCAALLVLAVLAVLAVPDVAGADVAVPCGTDVALGQPSAQAGQGLVAALLALYTTPGATQTLQLDSGCAYLIPSPPASGTSAQTTPFHWYGPSGLPAIDGTITIDGNGATLLRQASETPFRFFYVGADPTDPDTLGYTSPGAGSLTLRQLTLTGGLARGGSAKGGGGGRPTRRRAATPAPTRSRSPASTTRDRRTPRRSTSPSCRRPRSAPT